MRSSPPIAPSAGEESRPVPFVKLLFQPVEGEVIVETSQRDIHGQTQSQFALRDQTRCKARLPRRHHASTGIFGAYGPPTEELCRDHVNFFGHLFSDPVWHFSAAIAARQFGLQYYRLSFQMDR
jgi:hypothetical protein